MAGVHPQEDLAPRDVVAAAISRRMARGAGRRRRPRVPRRHAHGRALLRALPVDHRGVPGRSASTRPATASRSPRPRTSPAAACPPTSTGAPRCPGCTPSARSSCTGRARRQPAGVATASPRGSSPAPGSGATWPGSCPTRVDRPTTTAASRRRSSTRALRPRSASTMSRHVGVLRTSESLAAAAGALDAGRHGASTGVDADAGAAFEATNLLTVGAGRGRRRGGAHREPRLPPPHRLPRPARRVADATSTSGSTPTERPVLVRRATPAAPTESCVRRALSTRSPTTPAHRLLAAGLDPGRRRRLVRAAVDRGPRSAASTSRRSATVPADQRSVGTFAARAARRRRRAAGRRGGDRRRLRRRRQRRRAPRRRRRPGRARRRRSLDVDGADPTAAHRRAHRAQPAVPPVRRGHADRGGGPTRWPAPAASCATRARRCPGCAPCRSTPCAAAAASTTAWALCDAALVKDNHVARGRRRGRGVRRGAVAGGDDPGGDRGRLARRAARGDRRRRRRRAARQLHARRRCARPSPCRDRARRRGVALEASGGLTARRSPAEVGETGVDYVAVGELTHSAPVLDLGLDLETTVR